MTALEASYRRALRIYPKAWRAQNEEVVLGMLLDGADAEGRPSPSPSERVSLTMNGLAAHLDAAVPSSRRDLAAASAIVMTTGFALFDGVFFEWEPWSPAPHRSFEVPVLLNFSTVSVVPVVLWLIGVLIACSGYRKVGRGLLGVAGLTSVAEIVAATTGASLGLGRILPTNLPYTAIAVSFGAVFALLGTSDRALRPERQLWGAVLAAVTIALAWRTQGAGFSLRENPTDFFRWWRQDDAAFWTNWSPITGVVPALVLLALAILYGARRDALGRAVSFVCAPAAAVVSACYLSRIVSSGTDPVRWVSADGLPFLAAALAIIATYIGARVMTDSRQQDAPEILQS